MSRQKKYKMKAIPSAISEKGGYTAQFVGDGYSVDARKEILPGIIKANGVQVGEGVAWNLIQAFLKECATSAAKPVPASTSTQVQPSSSRSPTAPNSRTTSPLGSEELKVRGQESGASG